MNEDNAHIQARLIKEARMACEQRLARKYTADDELKKLRVYFWKISKEVDELKQELRKHLEEK